MNSLVCAALFASAAVAVSADLLISPITMTHNQAVDYCAKQNSHLLDVYSSTTESVSQHLEGKVAWIGSWDYNSFNGACLGFINSHIGIEECTDLKFAVCSPVNLLKSTHVDHNSHADHHVIHEHHNAHAEHDDHHLKSHLAHETKGHAAKDQKSAGPRVSRNSRNHKQKNYISSDSSSYGSSSSNCGSSGSDCGFEYVYLTNTVTQVWTSVEITTVTTSTVTNWSTIGTVAAYVVTPIPSGGS